MGGWDVYCALCGSITRDDYRDGADEGAGNQPREPLEDTSWLGDIRIIGENPECLYPSKIYIGKTTRYDDWGYFDEVEAGGDLHFFNEDPKTLRVYDNEEGNPLAIPLHAACLELLQVILGPDDIDRDILYETLKSLVSDANNKALALVDYGSIAAHQDQYWDPIRAPEAYEARPTSIPRLARYYGALPVLQDVVGDKTADADEQAQAPVPSKDPFGRLPVELLSLVMANLDMSSVINFKCASRAASRVVLGPAFWRARVRDYMPWLYDFPASPLLNSGQDTSTPTTATNINWARVYHDLLRASEPWSPSSGNDKSIRGLVNRRRIWPIAQQIAAPYRARQARKTKSSITDTSLLDTATSTPLWRLVTPEPRDTASGKVALLGEGRGEVRLDVHWNEKGELAGMSVIRDGEGEGKGDNNNVIGQRDSFARTDEVRIRADDWLAGFVVTSEERVDSDAQQKREAQTTSRRVTGLQILFTRHEPAQLGASPPEADMRLIRVSGGKCVVGLLARWSAEEGGGLAKLALLEQPAASISPERTRDLRAPEYNPHCTPYLWRSSLPPPPLHPSEHETGYWSHDLKPDVSPVEHLSFLPPPGAALTSLAADVQLGAFEARFSDGGARRIGPRPAAVKRMRIDGAGGERVVAVVWYVDYLPNALRVRTNWGREMCVGHAWRRGTVHQDNPESLIAGLYAHWGERHTPKTRLEAVGALRIPRAEANPETDILVSPDATASPTTAENDDFPWDPSPPSPSLRASGPVFGQHELVDRWTQRRTPVPGPGSWACWADLRQRAGAVSEVRATLCHGVKDSGALPLSGVGFRFAGGEGGEEEVSIGPSEFASPDGWCWCHLEGGIAEREGGRPHYMHETWRLGDGETLRSLRVWVGELGELVRMQFTASGREGGQGVNESPAWGRCEGVSVGEMLFGEGEERVAGIKFYMGDNKRNVTRGDTIVVAVQGMVAVDGA
ncbi:hypothetical protein F4810DRAFT_715522 [Camillea tinctor]|nr:hypothetical protein F4810DRAFT_715522 [Camillea tinctor]